MMMSKLLYWIESSSIMRVCICVCARNVVSLIGFMQATLLFLSTAFLSYSFSLSLFIPIVLFSAFRFQFSDF